MKRPKSKVWGTLSFFVLYVACLCYELLHNQCGTETCWPMICPILTCQTFSSWAQLEHQSKTTCTKMSEVQINFNRTILEPFKLQFFFTNTKVQYFFVYSLILNANTTLPKTVFLYIGHLDCRVVYVDDMVGTALWVMGWWEVCDVTQWCQQAGPSHQQNL